MDKEKQTSAIRTDVNKKLKEEFDMLHEEIVRMLKNKNNGQMNICGELIKVQLSLAAQIIREERDLNGKGAYAFPPYTPSKINQ